MGPNAEDHAGVPDHVACEHCGRCLQVCPAYLATQVETFSPRGRTDLITAVEAGALTPGPRFEEALQLARLKERLPAGVFYEEKKVPF